MIPRQVTSFAPCLHFYVKSLAQGQAHGKHVCYYYSFKSLHLSTLQNLSAYCLLQSATPMPSIHAVLSIWNTNSFLSGSNPCPTLFQLGPAVAAVPIVEKKCMSTLLLMRCEYLRQSGHVTLPILENTSLSLEYQLLLLTLAFRVLNKRALLKPLSWRPVQWSEAGSGSRMSGSEPWPIPPFILCVTLKT